MKPSPLPVFADVTKRSGIRFKHEASRTSQKYLPESMGAGVAMFDYDNNGHLDLFFVNGAAVRDPMPRGASPDKSDPRYWNRLYRNNGDSTFTDVTEAAGLRGHSYGMGVATGDFNNDGWVDLYITNFGHNQLWRNNGNGTFTDVTRASGTDVLGWSTSAAFVDFDHDGWLDLFVANYVNFRFTDIKKCFSESGTLDYCGPLSYDPLPNRLFRNRRDGTFEDVTATSQIGREFYGALGVVCADFNGDGLIDIYVANDERPNLLWINQGNGTFKNQAMLAGALDSNGVPQSSMGVDAGDVDNDGAEDLIVANLTGEYADLYRNAGKGWFEDRSAESGLATVTMPYTGFGAGFLDYDNDGWLDVFIANGAVKLLKPWLERVIAIRLDSVVYFCEISGTDASRM